MCLHKKFCSCATNFFLSTHHCTCFLQHQKMTLFWPLFWPPQNDVKIVLFNLHVKNFLSSTLSITICYLSYTSSLSNHVSNENFYDVKKRQKTGFWAIFQSLIPDKARAKSATFSRIYEGPKRAKKRTFLDPPKTPIFDVFLMFSSMRQNVMMYKIFLLMFISLDVLQHFDK
jgi:hypothetical protein